MSKYYVFKPVGPPEDDTWKELEPPVPEGWEAVSRAAAAALADPAGYAAGLLFRVEAAYYVGFVRKP